MSNPNPGLSTIKSAAQKVLNEAYFACVLGSAMTQYFQDESDIDIAVFFDLPPTPMKRLALQLDLEAALNRTVDLIVLNQAGPIMRMQVLKRGKPLFIHDRKAYSLFRMHAISEYADFKMDRMPVESSIVRGMLP